MPQSPTTPHRRRRSSNFGSPTASQSNNPQPGKQHSRKSSIQSIRSNTAPRPSSARGSFGEEYGEHNGAGNGLGSLADELAEEEWDDEYDEELLESINDDFLDEETPQPPRAGAHSNDPMDLDDRLQILGDSTNGREKSSWRANSRPKASDYDGSDYGGDDFDEAGELSPGLESRVSHIDTFVKMGISENKTADSVMKRVSEQLRDLGSQTNVETHLARLSTAYTALTTHMAHQSRILSSLTHPIVTPLGGLPDPDTAAELLSVLDSFVATLPYPNETVLPSIHGLHANTDDLLVSLGMLVDSLQVSRSTSNTAARQLRSAKEMASTLKREFDETEDAQLWLEKGDWDTKLSQKQAAAECRDVCDGFEKVCESWRQQLVDNERRLQATVA